MSAITRDHGDSLPPWFNPESIRLTAFNPVGPRRARSWFCGEARGPRRARSWRDGVEALGPRRARSWRGGVEARVPDAPALSGMGWNAGVPTISANLWLILSFLCVFCSETLLVRCVRCALCGKCLF